MVRPSMSHDASPEAYAEAMMWTFLEGFGSAIIVVVVLVALAPVIWLLCGGSLDGR